MFLIVCLTTLVQSLVNIYGINLQESTVLHFIPQGCWIQHCNTCIYTFLHYLKKKDKTKGFNPVRKTSNIVCLDFLLLKYYELFIIKFFILPENSLLLSEQKLMPPEVLHCSYLHTSPRFLLDFSYHCNIWQHKYACLPEMRMKNIAYKQLDNDIYNFL